MKASSPKMSSSRMCSSCSQFLIYTITDNMYLYFFLKPGIYQFLPSEKQPWDAKDDSSELGHRYLNIIIMGYTNIKVIIIIVIIIIILLYYTQFCRPIRIHKSLYKHRCQCLQNLITYIDVLVNKEKEE